MFKKIAVFGTGSMGSGIIQTAATNGLQVVAIDNERSSVDRGKKIIEKSLARFEKKGRLKESANEIIGRIEFATDPERASDADFVFEAIFEDIKIKAELYKKINAIVPETVPFASNTSSLSMTALAKASGRSSNFVGMHFFNPVPMMKLVEIIPALQTASKTVEAAKSMAEIMGKTAVVCKDTPGFIVNRILVPYMLEAARVYDAEIASPEQIDTAMKLGAGVPMGPLELMDFTGVDIAYFVGNILYDETKDKKFLPPNVMQKMVQAGWLGRKTGKGFYDYSKKD
ncbi:MAG: putative 3-hydroxybutyryl-CoA dehydrogenase [bacterium]|nr:MAG: putative 3-hydroxybutyryl-CoA dehydrogenase [bacterium]